MFWGLVASICLDFGVFSLIDAQFKERIYQASNLNERRQYWLVEVLCLVCAAQSLYFMGHTPALLLVLTAVTFGVAMLKGRNIQFRPHSFLKRKWQEFEAHLNAEERLRARQPPAVVPPHPPAGRQEHPGFAPNMGMGLLPVPRPPGVYPMGVGVDMAGARVISWKGPGEWSFQRPSPRPTPRPVLVPRDDLVRRPLRWMPPDPLPGALPNPPHLGHRRAQDMSNRIASLAHQSGSWLYGERQKEAAPAPPSRLRSLQVAIMSAVGVSLGHLTPGLQREPQLSFLNATLQCLAHSPNLLPCLEHDAQFGHGSRQQQDLIGALLVLVRELRSGPQPVVRAIPSVDSRALRVHLSQVPGSGVQNPLFPARCERQVERDPAGFLLWLLSLLSRTLNPPREGRPSAAGHRQYPAPGDPHGTNHMHAPPGVANAMGLQPRADHVFEDLTPQVMRDLEQQSKQALSAASSVDPHSYIAALQVLSDVEWLRFKEANSCVVDHLFTGQQVHVYSCLVCHGVSIRLQPFTVVSLPIVCHKGQKAARLDQAFQQYTAKEQLTAANFRCERCARNRPALTPPAPGFLSPIWSHTSRVRRGMNTSLSPTMPGTRFPMADPARADHRETDRTPALSSPELLLPRCRIESYNDSGYQEVRTSTPKTGAGAGGGGSGVDSPHGASSPSTVDIFSNAVGTRHVIFRQLPDCLAIQLRRYTTGGSFRAKDSRPVHIPLNDLTLPSPPAVYALYAVLLHQGVANPDQGHSSAYVKAADGRWFCCDDTNVKAVSMEYQLTTRLVQQHAYLLLYRRVR